MRRLFLGLATLVCVAGAAFAGCGDEVEGNTGPTSTSATGNGGSITTTSTTAATTTTGTGGSGTGGAGTGGAGGCAKAADCPGMDTDCQTITCAQGMCGVSDTAQGTPLPAAKQVPQDCLQIVCDGMGSTTTVPDDGDVSPDGTECTVDTCNDGMPVHTDVGAGATCADSGGKVCDATGMCVPCLVTADCDDATKVCKQDACVPSTCDNGVMDGGETGIDCGGGAATGCPGCADGGPCNVGGDCLDGVCMANVCQMPTCSDLVENGDETDVDCGGAICGPCANGDTCLVASDCVSLVCMGSPLVCKAPTCFDGVKNEGETDVDCAGPCAKKCGPGKQCGVDADCTGGSCDAVSHTCDPTCSDGVKNGNETDVDCGGGTCAPCALGKACGVAADCASDLCTGNVCSQLNGCDPASAVDDTGMAHVTIAFGGAAGLVYSPKCVKVTAGTMVTFDGDFASHPFQGGVVANNNATPAVTGPFAAGVSVGMASTFTMAAAGSYGFYCMFHWPLGMDGAVFVQ